MRGAANARVTMCETCSSTSRLYIDCAEACAIKEGYVRASKAPTRSSAAGGKRRYVRYDVHKLDYDGAQVNGDVTVKCTLWSSAHNESFNAGLD